MKIRLKNRVAFGIDIAVVLFAAKMTYAVLDGVFSGILGRVTNKLKETNDKKGESNGSDEFDYSDDVDGESEQ